MKTKRPRSPKVDYLPMTPFGLWLSKRGLSYGDAAQELSITRSYVQMLATGRATPKLGLAGKIEEWSKRLTPTEVVLMQTWLPWCAAPVEAA